MNKEQVAAYLAATNPDAVVHDWLDEALIGYVHRLGAPPLALYDLDRCIEITRRNGWDWPGADKFMRDLLVRMWWGDGTPAFAALIKPEPTIMNQSWTANL